MKHRFLRALPAALLVGSAAAIGATVPGTPAPSPAAALSTCNKVVVAAGDFSKVHSYGDLTAAVAKAQRPDFALLLGDVDQRDGNPANYRKGFARSAWNDLMPIIKPAPGNHDYKWPGASGYYRFFGAPRYYAYDIGCGWRGYSLNSEISMTAQAKWLARDLAAHPGDSVVVVWHRPMYSSGRHGGTNKVKPLMDALTGRTGVILNGHTPHYERFAPVGKLTQFIAGTGGDAKDVPGVTAASSVVRIWRTPGILRLDLGSRKTYSVAFIDTASRVLDRG